MDPAVYPPGQTVWRQWAADNYQPHQEAMWQAMTDTYYSRLYGFETCRMPSPGQAFDTKKFAAWKTKVVLAWDNESHRDTRMRGPESHELSDTLWLYWYERMLDAQKLID